MFFSGMFVGIILGVIATFLGWAIAVFLIEAKGAIRATALECEAQRRVELKHSAAETRERLTLEAKLRAEGR